MQHGLTVAQIYSELAAELKAENTATTLTLDGTDTPVVVVKPAGQAPTRGNIMDHAFTVTNAEGERRPSVCTTSRQSRRPTAFPPSTGKTARAP